MATPARCSVLSCGRPCHSSRPAQPPRSCRTQNLPLPNPKYLLPLLSEPVQAFQMSSRQSKIEKEREKATQDRLQAMLSGMLKVKLCLRSDIMFTSCFQDEDNKYCVDCDNKGPRWASWNLGLFLCIRWVSDEHVQRPCILKKIHVAFHDTFYDSGVRVFIETWVCTYPRSNLSTWTLGLPSKSR